MVAEDNLFGEDVLSKFDNAYPLEMYIKSSDGFEGDGDFLSKFGLEIRDEMVVTISQRRFGEEVEVGDTTEETGRPVEGDLIYFPLNGKTFEVKFVEHESIFYQMGSLQTYDLRCELFEYSHQQIDTGITTIDAIEDDLSGDMLFFELLDEAGNSLTFESGDKMIQDGFRVETADKSANNEFFQTSSASFIDFSEGNPFSEGMGW